MKRRDFIQGMMVTYGGLHLPIATLASEENPTKVDNGFPILQGFTDETSAQFTVDVPRKLKVHYEAVDIQSGRRLLPSKVESFGNSKNDFRVDRISFTDLYLGAGFYFTVFNKKNEIIDTRIFKTIDCRKSRARIAILSCMYDINEKHHQMWDMISRMDIDMYFLIGDSVYGDIGGVIHGPNFLWSRYIQTRQSLGLYSNRVLRPTIAVWDDHDFGKNNAGGDYKHKEKSLFTFNSFYGQEAIGPRHSRGPGASSSFSAFGQKFIFLDNRYWRSLPNQVSRKGYLGDDQLKWLKKELYHAENQTWIIQGSQTFGTYKRESGTFEYLAPDELYFVEKMIRDSNLPTWFVSGDVHFSEINKINGRSGLGFNSFEITSSSMHSLYKDQLPENSNRLAGTGITKENFIVVDIERDSSHVIARGYSPGDRVRFETHMDLG